jgi:hypothetical protein
LIANNCEAVTILSSSYTGARSEDSRWDAYTNARLLANVPSDLDLMEQIHQSDAGELV